MAKKDSMQEDAWLDNAFLYNDKPNATTPSKKKGGAKAVWICILTALLVIGLSLGVFITYRLSILTILDGVTVAGVDVGGMTKKQAVEAVTSAIGDQYSQNDMKVTVIDSTIAIPAAYSGGSLDVTAAVREARRFGQIAFPQRREAERQIIATEGYAVDLEPYMQIDEAGIQAMLIACAESYDSKLTQSTYKIIGNRPTDDELAAGQVAMQLVIELGTADYLFDFDAMYRAVVNGYSRLAFEVEVPCQITEPNPIDLEGILAEYGLEAMDAYMDPDTYDLYSEHNGYGFDVDAVKEKIQEAGYGATVTIDFALSKPKFTYTQLMAELFKDTLSTTTAKSSSQGGRDVNLRLACEALNGVIVKPGQSLSYNEVLGERTTEKGYKGGAAYSGGKTIYVTGGGICQVSSTLYSSVVLADLEIVTRENHGYAVSYLPLGIDATVSWGGPEFVFRNNTTHPILIEAYAEGGHTTVTLKGIDDKDYYVKFENAVLRSMPWKTVYETMKANNPDGYTDGEVLVTPYTGYEVKTYRCKYDKKTNKEISRELEAYSYYSNRDKVVVKIEQAATPTDPTTPTFN